MNYKEIISSISNKDLNPVYFLMGDEPYYIDKLSDEFSNNLLTAEEQEFWLDLDGDGATDTVSLTDALFQNSRARYPKAGIPVKT